jgi:hypothetical protein
MSVYARVCLPALTTEPEDLLCSTPDVFIDTEGQAFSGCHDMIAMSSSPEYLL